MWDRRKQETAAKGAIKLRTSGVTNLQRVTETGATRTDEANNIYPDKRGLKCRIVCVIRYDRRGKRLVRRRERVPLGQLIPA